MTFVNRFKRPELNLYYQIAQEDHLPGLALASCVMTYNFHSGSPSKKMSVIFQKHVICWCLIISWFYLIYRMLKLPGDKMCLMTDDYCCTHTQKPFFPFFLFGKWYLVLFCTTNLLISILSHLIWRTPFYECMVINPAAHTICHARDHSSFAINRSSVMVCEGFMPHSAADWQINSPLLQDVSIKSSDAERCLKCHGVWLTHAH